MNVDNDTKEVRFDSILDIDSRNKVIGIEIINLKYQAERAGIMILGIKLSSNNIKSTNFDSDSDCLYIKITDGCSTKQVKSEIIGCIILSNLSSLRIVNGWQIGS